MRAYLLTAAQRSTKHKPFWLCHNHTKKHANERNLRFVLENDPIANTKFHLIQLLMFIHYPINES